ncbi:MAG: hypothetical protein KF749_07435 [Bacteroidetes bacterium]|nr:hypothetical protein [Bacteroidota bacterium]MCW5896817.1 hypothetical protein [Bacteroidota bacterium]
MQFFYFGFYKVLKRYRLTSITGWVIVLLGCLSIPLGWQFGRTAGPMEVLLAVLTMFAGFAVVWQNIAALEEYLHIPFPFSSTEPTHAAISETKEIMKDVLDGGWQEAFEAIGRLRALQVKHSLPPLESH